MAGDFLVEVQKALLAGRLLLKPMNALGQLAGLEGGVANQGQSITGGLVRGFIAQERLAERDDASHDIAEIVGQARRKSAEVFFPGEIEEPALGRFR